MTKFTLQPYKSPSSRYRCPACNSAAKSFVRYIDTETGEQLADNVGRCGRVDKCGYHYPPRNYFRDNPGAGEWKASTASYLKPGFKAMKQHQPKPFTPDEAHYIDPVIVNGSFTGYQPNNFVQYLINSFGHGEADKMMRRYFIGTSKHWHGATVFWQLDVKGNVRTGKIMLYDTETGRRIKKPFNHITWVHSALLRNAEYQLSDKYREAGTKYIALLNGDIGGKDTSDFENPNCEFKLNQCLFGEHLLADDPAKPVAIVESEKTAIIASSKAPGSIWLAAGSLTNLNPQICQVLQNRRVTLYPDLGAYHKWKKQARQLQLNVPGSIFTVSDILEKIATDEDRANGLDLGDYL
jgi:hypothetical protein